jgi:DNA-binding transcriptional ArsR family regulator
MGGEADISQVARMFSDPARAAMCVALLDGTGRSAGELARAAGVSPAAASPHLAKLVRFGVLRSWPAGRHKYFTLASPAVARALEALALIAPTYPATSLRQVRAGEAIRRARLCYDHLAGELGVTLAEKLVARGWLTEEFMPTGIGLGGFAELGIAVERLRRGRRTFARPCLDWTVRRPHLAGALGAALTRLMIDRRWILQSRGTRAVEVTAPDELFRVFGVRTRPERESA